MKLSRSYVLGLGSGLILSALIAMLLPLGNIHFGETLGVISMTPTGEKSRAENSTTEKTTEGNPALPNLTAVSANEKSTDLGNKGTFSIPAGASAEKIADLLLSERWITSREGFLTHVKERNLASKFKAGSFELSRTMGIEEIVTQLMNK